MSSSWRRLCGPPRDGPVVLVGGSRPRAAVYDSGGNCIKIGLPGKWIFRDYFHDNITSQRPFLFLRISFPGRSIFIKFIPVCELAGIRGGGGGRVRRGKVRRVQLVTDVLGAIV